MIHLAGWVFWIIQETNLNVFNVITEINESKTLIKHISCKWKCKFDIKKSKLNPKWNSNKCQCECKKAIN